MVSKRGNETVRSLVRSLARSLGGKVVAEGVSAREVMGKALTKQFDGEFGCEAEALIHEGAHHTHEDFGRGQGVRGR